MKTERFERSQLRNEEHFQFGTDILKILSDHNPEALKIQHEVLNYADCQAQEGILLNQISTSASTKSLAELDGERDDLFRGLVLTAKGALYHFDAEKRSRAGKLSIILAEYGNIARKSYDAESAALSKLTAEAKSIYKDVFEGVGLLEWIDRLEAVNNEFQAVMHERYQETAEKQEGSLREFRLESDAAYLSLMDKLDAFMLITGDAMYAACIKELNACAKRYENMLAMRKGRKSTANQN